MQTEIPASVSDANANGVRPDVVIAGFALSSLFLAPLLGAVAPLVFLLFGLFLAARKPASTIDALTRNWYLLILPLYALASTLWSVEPALSLRYGVQLVLTFVVAIVIANRITPYSLLAISYVALLLVIVASVLFGGARADGIALGVFAAKNAYATHITMFALASLGVLFAPESNRLGRLAGLAGLLAAPVLLLSAQSSGAAVTLVVAAAAFVIFALGGVMHPGSRRSYFAFIFAVGAVAAVLIAVFHQQILGFLLDLFEKDATITGRTELWEIGTRLIDQRPFLGLGYQGFWVQENALAEELWAYFNIPNRSGFHFHNTYISIGVELGMIGTALTALLLGAVVFRVVQWAVKEPFAAPAYFVAFAILIASRSFVEVDVFYQFSATTVTMICGLIYANRALASSRARKFEQWAAAH